MKFVALVAGLLLLALPLMAQEQEQTFFGANSTVEQGGFGAPVVKFTKINGKLGVLAGARAGWIVGHVLSLGVGGYYLVNNVLADAPGPRNDPYLNLYYGGLDLELIVESDAPVHLSFNSLVGAGAVGTRFALFSQRNQFDRWGYEDYHYYHHHHYGDDGGWNGFEGAPAPPPVSNVTPYAAPGPMDGFFVVEPGVNLDFNMTHSFRLSFGGSYRWVEGVKSAAATKKELTGPSAMVTFRFGKF